MLFSLVPLAASNTLGYLRSRGIIERLIERNVESVADIRARQVQGALNQQVRELQNLASATDWRAAGAFTASGRSGEGPAGGRAAATLERLLARQHEELPGFDALFLLRADGSLVVHTGRADAAAMRLPDRTPITYSLITGDAVRLRLLAPARDADGLTAGYLGGTISSRGFQLLFGTTAHEEGSIESYLLDGTGRPIFAAHAHAELNFATPLPTPLLDAGPAGRVAHYRDHDGRAVVGTLAAIPETGWYYLAEAPVSAVLSPLTRLRTLSFGFAAGLCGILGMAAWLVAGGIVAPVRRLVSMARRVGAGDLGIRVHERQRDEVGELAAAFNDMTAELERTSTRVRELHRREIERAGQLATVGEMASSVAHEIKNPVSGIASGLDLVRRRLGDDAVLTPIMDEMRRQLQRIEGAVRDLLSYARPSAPSLAAAPVASLVERAARLVQIAADSAGVTLRLDVAPGLPLVQVDAELITQALVNVLLNAVQATPAGGDVVLRAGLQADELCIAIADTGRGISAEDLPDIFKPFFTTRHAGTGLGLSITRDVVDRHGGRMHVDSAIGRGSTFTILLPIREPAAQRVSA
jgi:signal transduction histidine kinase